MKIIDSNKIDMDLFRKAILKPELYEKSTDKFWDDEYISAQMLSFHLDPDIEAASKTKKTIEAEADFIIKSTDMREGKTVLDLGCGPGLYVKEFAKTGAMVTGIDLSERSIAFANKNIQPEYGNVQFHKMNYLDMDYMNSFDIATLIFYDFCALSHNDQNILLTKIRAALKDDGFFLFDIVTEHKETAVSTSISVNEAGFWSPKPHIEIIHTSLYDSPKTEGLQYTLIEEDGSTRIIRIYHRLFSLSEITEMLQVSGLKIEKVFENLEGDPAGKNPGTYGIIARKAH